MAPRNIEVSNKRGGYKRGAWSPEEDAKLSKCIGLHEPKKWKILAIKSGLNRSGKSCRLRWLNYLRPNIKRGNISSEEEDLVVRLHKLLGNRWSLIAGRIPGRTDNEIKNYWNSHLSKKINHKDKTITTSEIHSEVIPVEGEYKNTPINFDVEQFFDFSTEDTYGLDWVNQFLELDN